MLLIIALNNTFKTFQNKFYWFSFWSCNHLHHYISWCFTVLARSLFKHYIASLSSSALLPVASVFGITWCGCTTVTVTGCRSTAMRGIVLPNLLSRRLWRRLSHLAASTQHSAPIRLVIVAFTQCFLCMVNTLTVFQFVSNVAVVEQHVDAGVFVLSRSPKTCTLD